MIQMKNTNDLNPIFQLNYEKPGKRFFDTFGNIAECLKT